MTYKQAPALRQQGDVANCFAHDVKANMYGKHQRIMEGVISDYDKEQSLLSFDDKMKRCNPIMSRPNVATARPDSPFKCKTVVTVYVRKTKKVLTLKP